MSDNYRRVVYAVAIQEWLDGDNKNIILIGAKKGMIHAANDAVPSSWIEMFEIRGMG